MVTVQVQRLIDFVAEVFARSESSLEEARRIATYLTTANRCARNDGEFGKREGTR
jgi:hydroxycarboxylate dehydrogenase B